MSIDHPPPAPEQRPAPAAPEPRPEGRTGVAEWARLGVVLGLLVLLTATTGLWGLVMVLGIVVMIFLHELGHFVMAKRAGMQCTEFFLGFGPRIWSFRRGETEYGLKAIPAGAYVKITGMHNIEEVDPADEGRTYRQKPFWQRFGVAVAGSSVHFLLALGLIYTLLVGFGTPGGTLTPGPELWRVGSVQPGSAAEEAGLQEGDDVTAIDGLAVATFDDLRSEVVDRPGEAITLSVVRDGQPLELETTLGTLEGDADVGFLGVGQIFPTETRGPIEAVPASFQEFGEISVMSVQGLGRVFSPSGIADFGSQVANARSEPAPAPADGGGSGATASAPEDDPDANRLLSLLGVFRIGVGFGDAGGVANVLLLFVFINIFIGLFNLVPLLPFDGGHVAIAVYEKVQEARLRQGRRYFADVGKLLPMTYAVVLVLGLIFVSTLYLDIANPLDLN